MTPLATADRFYSKHFLCHILPAIKWTQTDLLNQKPEGKITPKKYGITLKGK